MEGAVLGVSALNGLLVESLLKLKEVLGAAKVLFVPALGAVEDAPKAGNEALVDCPKEKPLVPAFPVDAPNAGIDCVWPGVAIPGVLAGAGRRPLALASLSCYCGTSMILKTAGQM